jgi:hypothetical protein
MKKRSLWILVAALVLAAVGVSPAAAGKPEKPADPILEISVDAVSCLPSPFGVEATATATATGGEVTSIHIGIAEYAIIDGEAYGYYPFEARERVADWGMGLGGSFGVSESLTISTRDGGHEGHNWNTAVSDGAPQPGSWYQVSASAEVLGERVKGQRAFNAQVWSDVATWVLCSAPEPVPVPVFFEQTRSPWEDWNYEDVP